MRLRAMVRRLPVAGAAVAGAVLAHTLIYATAAPDPGLRQQVLARTGHGYWSVAAATAVLLGVLAAAGTVARRLVGGPRPVRVASDAASLDALACRLTVLQVAIYTVQEVVERLVAGVPVDALGAFPRLLLTGFAVQGLVALGVAALLVLLGRVAEAVARILAARVPQRPSRGPAWLPAVPAARASRLAGTPVGSRAPPVASIS